MLFVYFKDKFSPIAWKLTILTLDTKHNEESKRGFMKNWRNEEEYFEKVVLEVFRKWKN